MKTKNILFLNIILVPVLVAIFFHDYRTLMFNFSFDIDAGWIYLISATAYFSIPINIIYCLFLIFKKKENLKTTIISSLVGVATSFTAGVFVLFWLENFFALYFR